MPGLRCRPGSRVPAVGSDSTTPIKITLTILGCVLRTRLVATGGSSASANARGPEVQSPISDRCDDTPVGIPVDAEGRPLADLNHDCTVDLRDFGIFQESIIGP